MAENDIINPNVQIIEDENGISTVETIDVIDVADMPEFTIDTLEAFPALGELNEELNHALLNNRELMDQHPITAITGLREELDSIEELQVVYSNEKRSADYYMWEDANPLKEKRFGYFVSLCEDVTKIKICTGDNVFGVTVHDAAFIGGQSDTPRDAQYGLVVYSGFVAVKCASGISVGDYVIANVHGVAEKVNNGYGYQVVSTMKIDGENYVVINFQFQMSKMRAVVDAVDTLDERVKGSETNIISAINVATQAYNMANNTDRIVDEVLEKVGDAIVKVEQNKTEIEEVTGQVVIAAQNSVEAKAIAESAIVSVETARKEAMDTANASLANVNQLIKDLEPITEWEYVDPATGETSTGAEYLTTYIKDGLATKAEVQTVEHLTESNKSAIEQNAEGIQTLVSSIDVYSVGEYSQAYGLTREQAASILKPGMIYIPTKHKGSDTGSHTESYTYIDVYGNPNTLTQSFTPGYRYYWADLTEDNYNDPLWVESYAPIVAFSIVEPLPTSTLEYWYIDSDIAPEGYEPYALYKWHNKKWTKVNILSGNVTNRITSTIRQTANEVALEVTNARGSAATLGGRITETEANVNLIASWKNTVDESMAAINLTADDIGASISQIVKGVGVNGEVNAASIVTAINSQTGESAIRLKADQLNLNGTVTANGNFAITTEGKMIARSGYIGNSEEGFHIKDKYIANDKLKYNDLSDGVYLGVDGIGLGAGKFYVDKYGNATLYGDIVMGGNITWGPGSNPALYLYYVSQYEIVPDTPYYISGKLPDGWTTEPTGVTSTVPYEYISHCVMKDGSYKCSTPVLWAKYGRDGDTADISDDVLFDLLVEDKNKVGIFYKGYVDENGVTRQKMFINASYIRTGSLTFGELDVYQQPIYYIKPGATDGDYLNLPGLNVTSYGTSLSSYNAEGSGLSIGNGAISVTGDLYIGANSISGNNIHGYTLSSSEDITLANRYSLLDALQCIVNRLDALETKVYGMDRSTGIGHSVDYDNYEDCAYCYARKSGDSECKHDSKMTYNDDVHYAACTKCGAQTGSAEMHKFNSANGKCDACDYECNHPDAYIVYQKTEETHQGTCTKCGKVFAEKPHEFSETGPCVVCGYVQGSSDNPSVCEHINYKHIERMEPTCVNGGVKEHWHCLDCDTYFVNAEFTESIDPTILIISATGEHTANSTWVSEPGSREHWQTCKNCDERLNSEEHHLVEDMMSPGTYYCDICAYGVNSNGEAI